MKFFHRIVDSLPVCLESSKGRHLPEMKINIREITSAKTLHYKRMNRGESWGYLRETSLQNTMWRDLRASKAQCPCLMSPGET